MKRIAVLGSTGSIGTQTLEIITENPGLFRAEVLAAGHNVDRLIDQSVRFRPSLAVIADESCYPRLRQALDPLGVKSAAGDAALADAAALAEVDTVLTATVGYSGLEPTLRAIAAGKDIALANKETLVVAGELVMEQLKNSPSRILPVDSEHSAIFQCLQGEDSASVSRLLITASGGPFRHMSAADLVKVTPAEALRHPRWTMGAKITIDSATMLNKAFEIIEARWLFDIAPEKIVPLIHPQSVIHSMVEFSDGAVKAQLGVPDMHLPIRYALGDATRIEDIHRRLSLPDIATLTFEEPDYERFPCLGLASLALSDGGTSACVINAANEIANDAFRRGFVKFTDIYRIIMNTLEATPFIASPTYEDYVATNDEARRVAIEQVTGLMHT